MNKNLDDIPVPSDKLNLLLIDMKFRRFLPYIEGKVLDVGCGAGIMTKKIFDSGFYVEGVDGSQKRIDEAKKLLPDVLFHTKLFEEFNPETKFDTIILSSVLEHFYKHESDNLLQLCHKWLKPKGIVICAVPNRNALHKIICRANGFKDELTEKDIEVGHHVLYDFVSLSEQLRSNEFSVTDIGGVLLKPAPNSMLNDVPTNVLEELFVVSDLPNTFHLASVIYVVAKND